MTRLMCRFLYVLAAFAFIAIYSASSVQAQNAVANPGFEIPNPSLSSPNYPTSITRGDSVAVIASAEQWFIGNNTNTTTTSELLPSTDTLFPGGAYMMHITTGGLGGNGLVQFGAFSVSDFYADIDVYVLSGQVFLALYKNGGSFEIARAYSTTTNQWEHLSIGLTHDTTDELIVYSYGGPAEFYVDNAWVSSSGPRQIPTYFTVANVTGAVGQTVTLSAVFYRASDNTPLANKTVQVYVGYPTAGNPHIGNAVTDSTGTATFSYKIPGSFTAGTQPIAFARFPDSQYNSSQGSGTLTVMPSDTYFQIANVSGARGQTVTLSATLYRSSDNTPLANKTVSVGVDNVHIGNLATDSTGTAHFSYTIPTTASVGAHTIIFTRFADNQYNAGKGTATLTVTP